MGLVLVYSFLARGRYGGVEWTFTLHNYARFFGSAIYPEIFKRSAVLAFETTVLCLVVSYPLAHYIARRSPAWRNTLILLVVVPFWTNFLVRTYAWKVILRTEGVLNVLLQSLGLIQQPLEILFTPTAIVIGLVYGYLPFMVLPIYASIEKFDFSLLEAAEDLGANPLRAFYRVQLPLTMAGILVGCVLVFVPAIAAFITPDILGGAKSAMIGNLIQQQFLAARHWPFGSVLSIVLMAIVLVGLLILQRVQERQAQEGGV